MMKHLLTLIKAKRPYNTMKNLLNLTLALLTTVLIASCGSTGPEPEQGFEPYRIGSFMITSETKANYTGVNRQKTMNKAGNDTVEITQPGDYSFSITDDNTTETDENTYRIKFSFIDSTVRDRSDYYSTGFYSPERALNGVGRRVSISSERLKAQFDIVVNCTVYSKLDNIPYVYFKTFYNNKEEGVIYRIHVDSIKETIDLFTSCQS